MDVVLVYWKIKPKAERRFLKFWKNSLYNKPKGLINEFLSRLQEDNTNTWNLDRKNAVIYINVGLWEDKRYWKDIFPKYKPIQEFEACPSDRAWFFVKDERL